MRRFDGKIVLVTGAARGIGAAIATRFAEEGAHLALCDIDAEVLDAFAASIRHDGQDIVTIRADAGIREEIESFIEVALDRFGQIDVLVNNCGTGVLGYVPDITDEGWRRTMSVTLDSVFYASRKAIPHLIRTKGSIVNTGSISGLFGDYGLAAYNTAKGAVANLTRNMAIDHEPDGIRVKAVAPGGVRTHGARHLAESEIFQAEYRKLIPMGRMADPHEVAGAVAFLASTDASYITGINLVIDGGVTAATGQPNLYRLGKMAREAAGNS